MTATTVAGGRRTAVGVAAPPAQATIALGLAAAGALAVALRAPLATTVLGLVAFGIIHNVLELRYVFGRFGGVFTPQLLRLLLVGISGIALLRLSASGTWGLRGEIVIAFGLLAVVLAGAVRRRPVVAAAGLAAVAGATAVSLAYPAYHFVVLAHLHNVVPLVFLWEWAERISDPRTRRMFRAVQLGWVLVVPALVVLGAADGLLTAGPHATGIAVNTEAIFRAYTPPRWIADDLVGLRFVTAFAFLQTMHYAVWCWFLPRHARDVTVAFERNLVVGTALRGWRLAAVAVTVAAFFAVLFVSDYGAGRSVYGAVATYHAYLEFPVLLVLLLSVTASPSRGTQ